MNETPLPGVPKKKGRIAARFRNINTVMLLVTLILLALVVTVMITGITGDASRQYARLYSMETMERFSAFVEKDLVLVHKVSRSNVVTAWFADEGNPEKRIAAYAEIKDYAELAQDAYLYFGIHASLNEYAVTSDTTLDAFNHFDVIDPSLAYNNWYYECIDSDNEYTLNIDVDKATDTRRLWINHKVTDESGILGVFCSGLLFDDVINDLFGTYDANNISGFIIDKNGAIRMDSGGAEGKGSIYEISGDAAFTAAMNAYLGAITGFFGEGAEPEVIRLVQGPYGYMSIAPISGTDWSVITLFNENSLFGIDRLLPLLIAMLSAFALYTVASGALIRRLVLTPLKKLTASISAAGDGEGAIYGGDRDDEFGALAQTIGRMRDSLSASNAELQRVAGERARQGKLLHAVNSAAAVLLAADDERFEDSLRGGMALMARCMEVDRIYIWQNEIKNGELQYVQKFEWLRDEGRTGDTVRARTGFSYARSIPEWEGKFLRGECVNGPIASLSDTEKERLTPYGIQSILVIPVYLQDTFWGFVSFDDCHSRRVFAEDEVSILRSGSLMIASAMSRADTAARMRQADERAKLMLDATPLCCNMWNAQYENIDCNEEAVKLFELKDKQEYLSRFFELSPDCQPDGQLSSEKAHKYIKEAFERGRVVFEWMHQKLDGTPVPSEITLVRVKHGDGYIVTGYTRDMREYKKMMAEIEYRDTLLRTVNEAATILLQSEIDEFEANLRQCMGMMARSVDADRVYIWKNHEKDGAPYCTQMYEWSEGAEPQQGKGITTDVAYGESIPGWEERLAAGQCINGPVRDMSPVEREHLSPQGILSLLVVPVLLRGRFWGFVGFDDCHRERVFSDNEASILRSASLLIANALLRNEMTQGMRAAVAKMEAVISNYSGVIWSVDADNVITLFNGLYLKELGFTPAFVEGKSLEVARQKNRHLDIIENVQKTFDEGPQDWVSDIEGKTYRLHTTPLYGEGGSVDGVVGSIDDITDSMRLQKELERTAEEAHAASRAKSNFLSNMSHEMRTPMNAIIGMTLIGQSASDIERKDYAFGKIEDASNHLLGVINDILDMSKIEANKFELSDVEFGFEKMLQKVVNVISFRVDEKKQRLTVNLDSDMPSTLIGDDQRLAQVITNLLSNAVKFTLEEGSIHLDARCVGEESGVCTVRIEVADTGIGISPEQQARLFTSFEQAESSTSRKFGGTGLGLAISKRVVELMGGRIWVESELGKGSTFAFTVKLRRGAKERPSALKPGVNWGNVRVLAVDDELETRVYFAGIAERFKLVCDTAAGGEEALGLIDAKGAYDIYFVDWRMPGMDGVALTRRIKERGDDKSVVIMISAAEWNEVEETAKAAGVDKFLSKPLFPSDIADLINASIGAQEKAAPPPDAPGETESFEGRRILLAEDVEINREIVQALLEPTRLAIECAGNGAEAVNMFAAAPERYDMVFMDVQMPEMDGLEATRRIRALGTPWAAEVPIVAMTANVFREDIEMCLSAGMNDHVGKPIDMDELLVKLRRYLRAGGAGHPPD